MRGAYLRTNGTWMPNCSAEPATVPQERAMASPSCEVRFPNITMAAMMAPFQKTGAT